MVVNKPKEAHAHGAKRALQWQHVALWEQEKDTTSSRHSGDLWQVPLLLLLAFCFPLVDLKVVLRIPKKTPQPGIQTVGKEADVGVSFSMEFS